MSDEFNGIGVGDTVKFPTSYRRGLIRLNKWVDL